MLLADKIFLTVPVALTIVVMQANAFERPAPSTRLKGIAPKGSDALMGVVWFLRAVPNFLPARVRRDSFAIRLAAHQPALPLIAVPRHRAVHVLEIKFVPMGNASCPVAVRRFKTVSVPRTNIVMLVHVVCALVPPMFWMANAKPEKCAAMMI